MVLRYLATFSAKWYVSVVQGHWPLKSSRVKSKMALHNSSILQSFNGCTARFAWKGSDVAAWVAAACVAPANKSSNSERITSPVARNPLEHSFGQVVTRCVKRKMLHLALFAQWRQDCHKYKHAWQAQRWGGFNFKSRWLQRQDANYTVWVVLQWLLHRR